MEEGNLDRAAEEKHRLEEKQRGVRKQREGQGLEYKPKYFNQTHDPHSGENMYQFNNTYWKLREKNDYSEMPDLY